MFGPKPMGFWSGSTSPNSGPKHEFLQAGSRYKVMREFRDYDRFVHRVGETWTFCGWSFLPYDDGMSFFVSLDGLQEWHLRLQWRPEEQGSILDHLEEYVAPCEGLAQEI
jgi:hypothetical protein